MTNSLFREGGPYNVQKTGPDQYTMNISIPADEHGRTGRECPQAECAPGYFKVKNGTGIIEGQAVAYCPYCRYKAEPGDFITKEQKRYGHDIGKREIEKAAAKMIKDAFGLGSSGKKKFGGGFISMEMSFKEGTPRHVRTPFEDEVLRTVTCPYCGLDHAVFGLAVWCPDCGKNIFMEHVKAEYEVIRMILSGVDRRRNDLGPRIAAHDLENCLEDTVSIFEAVLKAMLTRYLKDTGEADENIQKLFSEQIRNGFQSPKRSIDIIKNRTQTELFIGFSEDKIEFLASTFAKRHPITHNLGVMDKKYLASAIEAEKEGKEVRVTTEEIEQAIRLSIEALSGLHNRLFCPQNRHEQE